MGQMIEFPRPDGGTASAYLADTEKAGGPALILIQEWWGLNPHILGIADRLAATGYQVLAPDLYRGRSTTDPDEASHLMGALDFADATHQDLAGALQFLSARASKIGVMGFCMGGALTIAAAVHLPGLAAASTFYGVPPASFADPATITIPLQGHFANTDDWCTPAVVDGFEKALKKSAEIYRYDAQHAFFNDTRPEVYDPAKAALAWDRTLAFFGQHLS